MLQGREAVSEGFYKDRKMHRVVVTGIGAVTPVGLNMPETFQNLIKGQSGIRRISTSDWELKEDTRRKDTGEYSEADVAGVVMDFDASSLVFPVRELRRIHRSAQMSLSACREALIQAGFLDSSLAPKKGGNPLIGIEPDRFGAIIGTGIGGGSVIADLEDILRGDKADTSLDTYSMLLLLPERGATVSSIWNDFEAEVAMVGGACATGSLAITDAWRIISQGEADAMAAGADEAAVHRIALHSFNNIHALNAKGSDDPEGASRPFDKGASGFVMGEGAAVLILESLEHAVGRGANILAEIVGYGNTADAYHDTNPNDIGAAKAIRKALAMAEIEPGEVDYINAHGTSTPTNDPNELKVFRDVFGENLKKIPISSTKSAIGHLLGAAGAVEAAIAVSVIQEGIIPPTLNLHDPIKEGEGLNLVPLKAQRKDVDVVLSDSLGFGGLNSVLIFRKFQRND